MATSVLILPGYQGSGETHWQTLWEKENPQFKRVIQRDWENPIRKEWVATLENAVAKAGEDVILVAHSLACLTVAHWNAQKMHSSISGALLVAPPDPKATAFPRSVEGFETTPLNVFNFPSIIVASSNDPYGSLSYAQELAKACGSAFVNVGEKGHINSFSDIGAWEEGYTYLNQLRHL